VETACRVTAAGDGDPAIRRLSGVEVIPQQQGAGGAARMSGLLATWNSWPGFGVAWAFAERELLWTIPPRLLLPFGAFFSRAS
jgi:hypothetical protein